MTTILSNFKMRAILLLVLFCSWQINAQTLPGTYTTSWVGNTFVPASNSYNFVQGWANSMFVESDGTIYTNCYWDEGAKELGIYKNGQCTGMIPNQHEHADGGAITANSTYIWATVHEGKISRFNKSDYAENGTEFLVSTATLKGLTASATELFVSDFVNNQIKVYSTANQGSLLRSWSVTRPGSLAMDASGNVWVLTFDASAWGPGTGACIKAFSSTGSLLKTITLSADVKAKSIAIDKTNNELLVADIGDNMQIQIYNNINGTPAFAQSFGTQGGILSSTKGLVAPLKFNVPQLVGVDASHNIIIWCNGNNTDIDKYPVDADGLGSCVESYTRSGVRNWQMLGLEFVDMGTFDFSTDGADFYTKHEHFTMDWSKSDGQQWTWKGWTLDRKAFPNDERMLQDGGHASTTIMRTIQGKKIMFMTAMASDGWFMYRFDNANYGEIAIPCGKLTQWENLWIDSNGNGQVDGSEQSTALNLPATEFWGRYVDNKGTIWMTDMTSGIRNYPVQSVNGYGVPVYSNNSAQVVANPAPFNDIRRVIYDSDNDIMYISGYTQTLKYTDDWKSCGLVMARYSNWSTGNRTAAYTVNLPNLATDGSNMVSLTVEKDYIFVVGVQTRGKVWVYNASNGALAGNLIPGSNVGGLNYTGWGDLDMSIAAYKKSNGEYLVSVEEDGWEKVMIYRWSPGTSNVPVTGVSLSPTSASINIGATQQLTATVAPSNATNKNLTWSTSNASIATVNSTGLITGVAAGNATITVTTVDGAKTATCAITVNPSGGGSWTIIDDATTGWTWGSFVNDPCGTCYNGTSHSVNSNNKSASRTFTGTDVEAYCETWSGAGSLKIYIDNVLKGTYTQNVTPYGGGVKFASITGLTNASHTIKFTTTSASWVGIDYIRVAVNPLKSALVVNEIAENTIIDDIKIYPNPASDIVNIEFKNNFDNTQHKVAIIDLLGKLIYKAEVTEASSIQINTNDFARGVYIIRVTNGIEIFNQKLVIK